MALSIEVGKLVTDRVTGKVSLVTDINGTDAHIVGVSQLERTARGDWTFAPEKGPPHGWIPVARLLAETF